MVIVINSVIGGFSWMEIVWLAASTVQNYNCTEWLVKNEAADVPIIFKEIVMVMIKWGILKNMVQRIFGWNEKLLNYTATLPFG